MAKLGDMPAWGWWTLGAILVYGAITGHGDRNQTTTVNAASRTHSAHAPKPHAPQVAEESAASRQFEIGERVLLKGDGDGSMTVALDSGAFNEMLKSIGAKDEYGFLDLLARGRLVILKRPTAAIYLNTDWDARVVRLTDGEHVGEKVWTIPAFIYHQR